MTSAHTPSPAQAGAHAAPRLLLLAHGSRRAEWARPFEAVLRELQGLRPDSDVRLCFLEAMHPLLPEALDAAALDACPRVRLVPLFLGTGAHLRDDVEREVRGAQARHPGLRVEVSPAAGDSPLVARALAGYALHCLDATETGRERAARDAHDAPV